MNPREQALQAIKEKLERLDQEERLRDRFPPETRVTYGRISGMFLGSYPDETGQMVYVEGETREEVEAIIASKLDLEV